ncbi:MAG: hypothetical protein R6V36_02640 [Psychroflexus sp.]
MKLQNSHYIIIGIVVVIVLISTEASAQGFPPLFDDDVVDEPVAPIDGLIALGLAVGGYLGIKKVRK